jgi:hypothetical protein
MMGVQHLKRLARARDLLAGKGFDISATVLACYAGAGFSKELKAAAAGDDRILLVDPRRLYRRG